MAGLRLVIADSPRIGGIPCWYLPIFAGFSWLLTLLAMLIGWLSTKSPHYADMKATQKYAYISNVGASTWGKPIFVTGATITVITFGIAFGIERWLRHRGLLFHASSITSTLLSTVGSMFTIAGAFGLMLLTIFDLKRHQRIHFISLGVFISGYLLAGTFMALEKRRLSKKYPESIYIRRSFNIKVFFVVTELVLAGVFGIFNLSNNQALLDCSVIVEWILSLFFSFYIWSFAVDFLPVPPSDRSLSLTDDTDQARLVEDIEKMCHLEMALVKRPENVMHRLDKIKGASPAVRGPRMSSLQSSTHGSRYYGKL